MNPRANLIVTCEHASPRIPMELQSRFQSRSFEEHEIYDPGALTLAKYIAWDHQVEVFEGQWSRLVMDLNRSQHHRRLSQLMDKQDAQYSTYLSTYYLPFRKEVAESITKRLPVIHTSIHSFTRHFNGIRRSTDLGILYDSRLPREKTAAKALIASLRATGLKVRANAPYSGRADGHTTALRKVFNPNYYIGIEIEVCQDLDLDQWDLGRRLSSSIGNLL